MPRTHPPYATEYRRRIVELARAGRSLSELGREFEPAVETIRQWVKQAELDEGRHSLRVPSLPIAIRPYPRERRKLLRSNSADAS